MKRERQKEREGGTGRERERERERMRLKRRNYGFCEPSRRICSTALVFCIQFEQYVLQSETSLHLHPVASLAYSMDTDFLTLFAFFFSFSLFSLFSFFFSSLTFKIFFSSFFLFFLPFYFFKLNLCPFSLLEKNNTVVFRSSEPCFQ